MKDNTQQKEFRNEELKNIVDLAKANGIQVWTFKGSTPRKYIGQVFFIEGNNIGTCSADYSGVKFGTMHKPCRECGTGFGINEDAIINSGLDDIKSSFMFAPHWAKDNDRKAVKKYTNWAEYLSKNTILAYYEL